MKEHLQQMVAEMTDQEAAETLALVAAARAGATPTDIYGTPLGEVLNGVDPEVLMTTGVPTITIPDGIPDVE